MDFQPRLGVVTRALQLAAPDLLHFFLVAGSVFLCYCVMGFLIFGNSLPWFATLGTSINTCFEMLLGEFADVNTDLRALGGLQVRRCIKRGGAETEGLPDCQLDWEGSKLTQRCSVWCTPLSVALAPCVCVFARIPDASRNIACPSLSIDVLPSAVCPYTRRVWLASCTSGRS